MTNDQTILATGRPLPRAIGKYRIDGVVGEGAMGVVYLGHDPDLDRIVAIKTVHAHLIADHDREEWLGRFAREARAAGRCMHGNLVTVFDYLQQDGAPHIVMEYVDAATLEQRIKGPALPQMSEVIAIMSQMLAGLQAIHDAGIIHRDLKPANVLLTEGGNIKLADFGVAKLGTMDQTGGGMIGTPSYMSPEQFAMEPVDHRADIYACGAIMYELIAGQKPYAAPTIEELVGKIRAGAPPRLSSLATGIPPDLDLIVRKALLTDRTQRFADARAFRDAVLDCFDEHAGPADGARTRIAAPAVEAPKLGQTMLDQIAPETFSRIEQALITQIGPIGKVIARKAA
ncbi:MAG: serine/threonine-protein kinase, partial [Pseudomonadota bacterium]